MKIVGVLLATLSITAVVDAASYSVSDVIPWNPDNSSSVDQSLIYNDTYYLADRSNKGVHVVNLTTLKQTGLITGGFQGLTKNSTNNNSIPALSGPNGIVILSDRQEMYIGDANGTVKIYDFATASIVANVSCNATHRADELAYNPDSGIVIATLPNEATPKVAIISTKNRTVNGYITFDNATGLEQPLYRSTDKTFYISVPGTTTYPGGAIAALDTTNLNVSKWIPLTQCNPAGIAFGPGQNLFVGCSQAQINTFNTSFSVVLDLSTGSVVANISGISGIDQVAYSSTTGYYFASAYQNLAGGLSTGAPQPQLAIIDSKTNSLVQTIVTDNVLAHSVAVDTSKNYVIVPIKTQGLVVYNMTNGTSSPGSRNAGVSNSEAGIFFYVILGVSAAFSIFFT